jgi:hypothetical protein
MTGELHHAYPNCCATRPTKPLLTMSDGRRSLAANDVLLPDTPDEFRGRRWRRTRVP